MRRQPHLAFKAQSLSEYTLACLLIGVACIGGFVVLSSNVSMGVKNLLPANSNATLLLHGSPSVINNNVQPLVNATASGIKGNAHFPSLPELQALPSNLSQAIETSGANGTTTLLANGISAVAKQLQSEGKIDSQQYSALIDLANQGHYIAAREEVTLKAAEGVTTAADYDDPSHSIVFDGTTISFADFWVSYTSGESGGTGTTTAVAKLESLYQNALNNGALSDPTAQKLVGSLKDQIISVGQAMDKAYIEAYNGRIPPDTAVGYMATQATQANALIICKVGNGKDTGVSCN